MKSKRILIAVCVAMTACMATAATVELGSVPILTSTTQDHRVIALPNAMNVALEAGTQQSITGLAPVAMVSLLAASAAHIAQPGRDELPAMRNLADTADVTTNGTANATTVPAGSVATVSTTSASELHVAPRLAAHLN